MIPKVQWCSGLVVNGPGSLRLRGAVLVSVSVSDVLTPVRLGSRAQAICGLPADTQATQGCPSHVPCKESEKACGTLTARGCAA